MPVAGACGGGLVAAKRPRPPAPRFWLPTASRGPVSLSARLTSLTGVGHVGRDVPATRRSGPGRPGAQGQRRGFGVGVWGPRGWTVVLRAWGPQRWGPVSGGGRPSQGRKLVSPAPAAGDLAPPRTQRSWGPGREGFAAPGDAEGCCGWAHTGGQAGGPQTVLGGWGSGPLCELSCGRCWAPDTARSGAERGPVKRGDPGPGAPGPRACDCKLAWDSPRGLLDSGCLALGLTCLFSGEDRFFLVGLKGESGVGGRPPATARRGARLHSPFLEYSLECGFSVVTKQMFSLTSREEYD